MMAKPRNYKPVDSSTRKNKRKVDMLSFSSHETAQSGGGFGRKNVWVCPKCERPNPSSSLRCRSRGCGEAPSVQPKATEKINRIRDLRRSKLRKERQIEMMRQSRGEDVPQNFNGGMPGSFQAPETQNFERKFFVENRRGPGEGFVPNTAMELGPHNAESSHFGQSDQGRQINPPFVGEGRQVAFQRASRGSNSTRLSVQHEPEPNVGPSFQDRNLDSSFVDEIRQRKHQRASWQAESCRRPLLHEPGPNFGLSGRDRISDPPFVDELGQRDHRGEDWQNQSTRSPLRHEPEPAVQDRILDPPFIGEARQRDHQRAGWQSQSSRLPSRQESGLNFGSSVQDRILDPPFVDEVRQTDHQEANWQQEPGSSGFERSLDAQNMRQPLPRESFNVGYQDGEPFQPDGSNFMPSDQRGIASNGLREPFSEDFGHNQYEQRNLNFSSQGLSGRDGPNSMPSDERDIYPNHFGEPVSEDFGHRNQIRRQSNFSSREWSNPGGLDSIASNGRDVDPNRFRESVSEGFQQRNQDQRRSFFPSQGSPYPGGVDSMPSNRRDVGPNCFREPISEGFQQRSRDRRNSKFSSHELSYPGRRRDTERRGDRGSSERVPKRSKRSPPAHQRWKSSVNKYPRSRSSNFNVPPTRSKHSSAPASPARQRSHTHSMFGEGDWVCEKCDNVNNDFDEFCTTCELTKNDEDNVAESQQFRSPEQDDLEVEESPGNEEEGPDEDAEDFWSCEACDNVNDTLREACIKCGALNPKLLEEDGPVEENEVAVEENPPKRMKLGGNNRQRNKSKDDIKSDQEKYVVVTGVPPRVKQNEIKKIFRHCGFIQSITMKKRGTAEIKFRKREEAKKAIKMNNGRHWGKTIHVMKKTPSLNCR